MVLPGLLKKRTDRLRLAASIVTTVLLVSFLYVLSYSAQVIIGDVDGSGRVDSTDYAALRRYILGISSFSNENGKISADVNGDNAINSTDYTIMRRYILGIITEFPVSSQQPTVKPSPTIPPKTGNVTYTLVKSANPTSDELDAYQKIETAMNTAINYYNTYTTVTKQLTISYVPSVSTADGNINGSIRFGSNRSYMNHITAMHEIAHTLGVGTSGKWRELVVNGVYTGTNAKELLKQLTGDNNAVLKGDGTHFWPYGLNYTSEVKSDNDLVIHCKLVNAMKKDGL
ncbi:MAG: hypothetical protein GX660_11590 [Clostridiaceae bacterium]|nr:hypothetical protein [Clostridiaceae bacterium]